MWGRGPGRILALAVALTVSEWLRGHLLTGFPWNAFGYALTSPLALAQGAALIGIWGLTFLAVAIYASPAVLADDRADTKRPWLAPALSAVVLAALPVYGTVRLRANPTSYVDGRAASHHAAQSAAGREIQLFPAAAGDEPLSGALRSRQRTAIERHPRRHPSDLAGIGVSVLSHARAGALAQIAALLPAGTVLITGAVRAPEGVPDAAVTRAYNSVYVIDHDGSILSVYDKVHLVPFGEYLPFQDFLEQLGLRQLTKMRGGFIPGDRRRVLKVPGAPDVLPLICYEIIFPEAVPRGERPGWMVNLTNDGWFGASAGPYQHLQQARIRAVEEGLPLVRAANTGISAVVDPVGRIIDSLPLGTEGVLDARLPRPTALTPYARTGDLPTGLLVAVAAALALRSRRRPPIG